MSSVTVTAPLMSSRATALSPTVLANVTVFLVDGYGYTGFLRFTKIAQSLGAAPNRFVQVPYNNQVGGDLANIVAGVATFDQMVNDPQYAGPKIACGISMGTQLLYKWIRDKSASASSYAQPSQLSFVLLANPENKYTGVTVTTSAFGTGYGGEGIPDTCPYTVQNFVRQWDGVGDYPNLPNPNQTALTNAWLGMAALHNNYFYVGLTDRTNFSHVEGPTSNLTYTWNQTYPAPIVGGMNDIWAFFNANPVPAVGDPIQTGDLTNRPLIESAYSRPVVIQTPTPSMVLPTPAASGKMLPPTVAIPQIVTAPLMSGTGRMLAPTVPGSAVVTSPVMGAQAFMPAPTVSPDYDNSAKSARQSTLASGTPFTWSATGTAGAYGIVFVECGASLMNLSATASVTWGGTAMTSLGSAYNDNTNTFGWGWVFGLNGIPGGAQTISVTLTQSGKTFTGYGSSYSYTNVSAVGSLQTAFGTSGTNPTLSVTAANPTDFVWGAILTGGVTLTGFSLTPRQSVTTSPLFNAGDATGSATVSGTASTAWSAFGLDIQ